MRVRGVPQKPPRDPSKQPADLQDATAGAQAPQVIIGLLTTTYVSRPDDEIPEIPLFVAHARKFEMDDSCLRKLIVTKSDR
jgi:hypothetical protein